MSEDRGKSLAPRRDVLVGAASWAFFSTLAPRRGNAQAETARLETRLFNFKDEVSAQQTAETVASLKAFAASPSVGGFLIGRNFISTPFPTRFEWVYMIEFDPRQASQGSGGRPDFTPLREKLSALCRNQVACDLDGPPGPHFADAKGVKVRHTVMFDFKKDASPADQARNVEAIRTMGRLPMVKAYWVERSADYPSDPNQMQWQVIGDFASVEDYKAYSADPAHTALRADFNAHVSRVAFLDVEL